jgi:ribosomal protein S18 acetylase RimI-like enzyme
VEYRETGAIEYRDDVQAIAPLMLTEFFEGWRKPLTPEQHLRVMENSQIVVIAVDPNEKRVLGFITALPDYVQSAFIPLLEVVSSYRGRGIDSTLVISPRQPRKRKSPRPDERRAFQQKKH